MIQKRRWFVSAQTVDAADDLGMRIKATDLPGTIGGAGQVFFDRKFCVGHLRTRSSRRTHTRHGNTTIESALLRFRNSASKSLSQRSNVVKPAPFLRAFHSQVA